MKLRSIVILLLFSAFFSCKKDFLSAKPDKRLAVPSTLQDFQALLDNADVMNYWMPYLGEISSDDYYLEDAAWKSLTYPPEKNGYIWAKEIFEGNPSSVWGNMYSIVFYANNVLEGLEKIKVVDDTKNYDEIKGSALFFRGYAFYQLSQIFCASFDASEDNKGLGIPLRLNSDINLPTVRSTIDQTYRQILNDLKTSAYLLPNLVSIKTRPNKTAAFAMLSKVYMLMQDYDESLIYADSVLLETDYNLLDLNSIDILKDFPIEQYNSEVIFQTSLDYTSNLTSYYMNVDSLLYSSFANNDLRKAAWFTFDQGRIIFKGNYNGASPYLFSGLALNEVLLNKAECLARKAQVVEAMNVLNMVLEIRFETGKFLPLTATEADKALIIILNERRKEMLFRGVRWSDLRRLNLEPETANILYRSIGGETYELLPGSSNYVFPIPDDVIRLSGIEQNFRK